MHWHPFMNLLPFPAILAPGRAKYPEYKSLICAMGVFRSQTPRALRDASYIYHNLAFAFHFGRIRPLFLPVSGLIFSLTTNRLLLFLSALFRYPCPYILQISTIWCSNQIPFSRQIHFHSCLYPLSIN